MSDLKNLLAKPRELVRFLKRKYLTMQVKSPLKRELSRLQGKHDAVVGNLSSLASEVRRLTNQQKNLKAEEKRLQDRIRETKETMDGIQ